HGTGLRRDTSQSPHAVPPFPAFHGWPYRSRFAATLLRTGGTESLRSVSGSRRKVFGSVPFPVHSAIRPSRIRRKRLWRVPFFFPDWALPSSTVRLPLHPAQMCIPVREQLVTRRGRSGP